ncbi:NAD-dependent epimerase/dehydratase family protein [Bacillus sp. SJS]|uniref:NAD-dependent epimerase/dehydratase family protein n=1 Tax=Bacillus sp. SJS TaxID=1423321 RepID=UPI0004DCE501|nr:NAD-dependent epimerase/dehydratase family protein [Bacillus sp. SJS]KZZ85064.1 UDP-glucose 4-epimerase [Bacillus sp. SJS]
MKVLVTGGCGFIGSHIVDLLVQEQHDVMVVDDLSTGKQQNVNQKAQYMVSSINAPEFDAAVEKFKPEAIIHQAAQVSVPRSIDNPFKDEEINIRGSLSVIESAKKHGVRKIIFASSAAVYGNPEYLPVDADHPTKPLAPYGVSKFSVEKYLQMAQSLYGIDYTILRYGNVYGPRQDALGEGGVIAIFAEALSRGEAPFIFGDGEQTRDFVYVGDVAQANVKALTSGDNKILNVSSADKITIKELFFLMNEISGNSLEPIFKEERSGDIRDSVLSNSDTILALDWNAEVNLPQGLANTLEFYKSASK